MVTNFTSKCRLSKKFYINVITLMTKTVRVSVFHFYRQQRNPISLEVLNFAININYHANIAVYFSFKYVHIEVYCVLRIQNNASLLALFLNCGYHMA